MKKKGLGFNVLTICLLFTFVLSACGSNNGNNANDANANTNTDSNQQSSVEPADPFGKYEPAIEVSIARNEDSAYKFEEGDDLYNNNWTRMYEDELGIKVNFDWTVATAQYTEKMNVAIASGDLPDVFTVNKIQLKKLVDSGQIADLTQVFEDYAAPFTKELLMQDGGRAIQSATFDGKLYAIPNTASHADGAPVLYIRTDWLKALELDEPTSMQDVLAIAEAFATQDPDGNGKQDTFGLAFHKDLWGSWGSLEGFFNAFGAYPEIWIKDGTGQLSYGAIQPEVKTALGALQELYSKGIIDQEFGVKDASKVAESIANTGMFFGAQWAPIWPLQANKEQYPEMEWKAFPILSEDGQSADVQAKFPVTEYTVVLKEYEHPEAVVKLNNMFIEKLWGETGDYGVYGTTSDGIEKFQYAIAKSWPALKNQIAQSKIADALENQDPSELNTEEMGYYNQILSYRDGDIANWSWEMVFGPEGSQSILNYYVNEDLFKNDEFYGAPTTTMASKESSLNKMMLEVFTKIIMGDASLDSFDEFVADWNKLGGSDMTNEVNEWYATQ